MADKKISGVPNKAVPVGTELVPLADGGAPVHSTLAQIFAALGGGSGGVTDWNADPSVSGLTLDQITGTSTYDGTAFVANGASTYSFYGSAPTGVVAATFTDSFTINDQFRKQMTINPGFSHDEGGGDGGPTTIAEQLFGFYVPSPATRAEGTVQITAMGIGDTVTSVTVNAVNLLGSPINWNDNLPDTMQDIVDYINQNDSAPTNYYAKHDGVDTITIRADDITATPNGYVVDSAGTGTYAATETNMAGGGGAAPTVTVAILEETLAGLFGQVIMFPQGIDFIMFGGGISGGFIGGNAVVVGGYGWNVSGEGVFSDGSLTQVPPAEINKVIVSFGYDFITSLGENTLLISAVGEDGSRFEQSMLPVTNSDWDLNGATAKPFITAGTLDFSFTAPELYFEGTSTNFNQSAEASPTPDNNPTTGIDLVAGSTAADNGFVQADLTEALTSPAITGLGTATPPALPAAPLIRAILTTGEYEAYNDIVYDDGIYWSNEVDTIAQLSNFGIDLAVIEAAIAALQSDVTNIENNLFNHEIISINTPNGTIASAALVFVDYVDASNYDLVLFPATPGARKVIANFGGNTLELVSITSDVFYGGGVNGGSIYSVPHGSVVELVGTPTGSISEGWTVHGFTGGTQFTGMTLQEEGGTVGNPSEVETLNFVGSSVTVTGSGSTRTVTVTDPPQPGINFVSIETADSIRDAIIDAGLEEPQVIYVAPDRTDPYTASQLIDSTLWPNWAFPNYTFSPSSKTLIGMNNNRDDSIGTSSLYNNWPKPPVELRGEWAGSGNAHLASYDRIENMELILNSLWSGAPLSTPPIPVIDIEKVVDCVVKINQFATNENDLWQIREFHGKCSLEVTFSGSGRWFQKITNYGHLDIPFSVNTFDVSLEQGGSQSITIDNYGTLDINPDIFGSGNSGNVLVINQFGVGVTKLHNWTTFPAEVRVLGGGRIEGNFDPNGFVVADRGTVFMRTDGVGSSLYVKEAGGGTVWVAK